MKYVLNPSFVKTDPHSDVLLHVKTGQRLEVSEETLKLISLFQKPATLRSAIGKIRTSAKNKRKILNFLRALIAEDLLISENHVGFAHTAKVLLDQALVEAPKKTFFSCPEREIHALEAEDIVFVGIPFDLGTTGYPGARFGPDRMRELSCDGFQYHTDIFSGTCKGWYSLEKERVVLDGIRMADIGNVLLQVGEGFDTFYGRVARSVETILGKGGFPVVVGGDHSSTYAVIKALKAVHDSLSVLHIDAHTDLGELIPNIPNNHGNVFTRIRSEGLVDHLYQFGVRGLIGEPLIASDYSLFSLASIERVGASEVAQLVESGACCYISVDIDVLDPSIAPGTGTPLVGGMTQSILCSLLTALIGRTKVVGFDIVEVNPMLDVNNRTSDLAIEILFHVLAEVFSPMK